MQEGRLSEEDRNALLVEMTDEVAAIVLEDNRLQTLALSIAERGGADALPPLVRAIEILEESGRLNRAVEGIESNEELMRRAQEKRGLTRPELAVLLSTSKIALQAALEAGKITEDSTLDRELCGAFPEQDAGAPRRRDPQPPAAQGDHRHQDRQPLRQPARDHRALLADRGGRRLVRPGRGRLRRRRAPVRHGIALAGARNRFDPRAASARTVRPDLARAPAPHRRHPSQHAPRR